MFSERLPPTISVEEAAIILGVSRRSAYRAANAGQIPTVRIGRRLLVPSAKLLKILGLSHEARGGAKPAPATGDTSQSNTQEDVAGPLTVVQPSGKTGIDQEGARDVAIHQDVVPSR